MLVRTIVILALAASTAGLGHASSSAASSPADMQANSLFEGGKPIVHVRGTIHLPCLSSALSLSKSIAVTGDGIDSMLIVGSEASQGGQSTQPSKPCLELHLASGVQIEFRGVVIAYADFIRAGGSTAKLEDHSLLA
jgi:hypothetical protein